MSRLTPLILACFIILLSALIPGVAAYEYTETFVSGGATDNHFTVPLGYYQGGTGLRIVSFQITDISKMQGLTRAVNVHERPQPAFYASNTSHPQYTAGSSRFVWYTGTYPGTTFATGTYSWTANYAGESTIQNWVEAWEFDEWNIPGYTSGSYSGRIDLVDEGIPWYVLNHAVYQSSESMALGNPAPAGVEEGTYLRWVAEHRTSPFTFTKKGYHHYYREPYWKNTVNIDSADVGYNVNVVKYGYTSLVTIKNENDATLYTNSGTEDIDVRIYDAVALNISIKDNEAQYHILQYTSTSSPTGTTTIYIRDAQTGSLIPDARVIITDTSTEPPTEMVNETLPLGTKQFDLLKSTTLKYLASATAGGYTPIYPILFGLGDDGTTIILWMSPDTPPDVPIEEGKSLLYGYALTQGSQQPISGATVALDGYGSTTTTSTGFYSFVNVTPGDYSITATATTHDPLSETVTVAAPSTQHNMALTGQHTLTVTVKDADTLANIQNATISLSDGQESTQNPVTFTVDYGTYTITTAAGGYYPASQYQYVDHPGTSSATVLMTAHPEPTPAPEYPNYPPHNVRFHCINDYGGPLANVTLSAAYLETTTPWSWFTDLLGIPSSVSINETTLNGTTGTDGSIVFSMVETVQYALTAHDPASNLTVNFTLYPQETQYTIQFRTRPAASAETYPIYILEAVPLEGDTQVSLRLAYKDRDNATTSLSFWVMDDAGEYIHADTLSLHLLGWTNSSYTVENHPTSYTWGFDAGHATRDDISAARTITLHGSGRLVDLGFEDDFWYYLLSALWIIGLGALFSGSRVKFGAIIIPLIGGGIPVLIGWLPLATAVLVGVLTFIGVFVYMRKSEYKLYR